MIEESRALVANPVKNYEKMESKMDGLAGAAGGCSCDKVLQIIA